MKNLDKWDYLARVSQNICESVFTTGSIPKIEKESISKNVKVRKQSNLILGLQICLPALQTPAHQTVNILMPLATTYNNIQTV